MFMFNRGALGLTNGTINWESDTIQCRLVLSSESPSADATSMTGIGITGNDQTLGSKSGPVEDTSTDRITYSAANPTFTEQAAGDPVNKLVIFKFVTNDAGSTPIALVEIDEKTPNDGDLAVTFAGNICFYLQNVPSA